MKLTCIIVDDELSGREQMKIKLAKWLPNLEPLALCENPKDALLAIVKHKPDILFLDINLHDADMNGLDFFSHIGFLGIPLQCILVTAHKEVRYYQEAMRLGLTNFVLKPVLQEDLEAAVKNVVHHIASGKHISNAREIADVLNMQKKIAFPTTSGAIYIYPNQIFYIKAAGKYSEMYLNGDKETIILGISEIEQLLGGTTVIKIDRSTMVNKDFIQKVSYQFNKITLDNGKEKITVEDVSKKGLDKVMEWMRNK